MNEPPLRILCVDDHAIIGEGLQTKLALERDMEFAGWLGSADTLIDEVGRTRANIVLLDIEMPGLDPFEVVGDLRRRYPDVRAIMLSAYIRDLYIDAAVRAGAWGYLSKSDEPSTVIDAIRKVGRGEFTFSPSVLERCRSAQAAGGKQQQRGSKLSTLTPRELQILRMIGKGMSRLEIAKVISRSPKTVDNHRAAIMEKLGIRERVDLARFAIREGLSEP